MSLSTFRTKYELRLEMILYFWVYGHYGFRTVIGCMAGFCLLDLALVVYELVRQEVEHHG